MPTLMKRKPTARIRQAKPGARLTAQIMDDDPTTETCRDCRQVVPVDSLGMLRDHERADGRLCLPGVAE